MNKRIIIAIDGHSSTGKSTVARELAKALGYVYVDTGAMYRAVTLFAIRQGLAAGGNVNAEALVNTLGQVRLEFRLNPGSGRADMYLNGENVEEAIRSMEVSELVSPVAAIPQVRKLLVAQQQSMGKQKGVVMDGRDIGTVVFPEAELKLFMTASPEIRAQRRYDELTAKGAQVDREEVYRNVVQRDALDSSREDSPLIQAPDAVVIDNSDLDRDAQFQKVLALARTAIEAVS